MSISAQTVSKKLILQSLQIRLAFIIMGSPDEISLRILRKTSLFWLNKFKRIFFKFVKNKRRHVRNVKNEAPAYA